MVPNQAAAHEKQSQAEELRALFSLHRRTDLQCLKRYPVRPCHIQMGKLRTREA